MKSKIEWTDDVWNPVTGCTKVSAGCKHCYAERFAGRQMGIWKGREFNDVRCHTDRLEAPLHWRKPRKVFVNSMSDLFHEDVPDDFIDRVLMVAAYCRRHTFIVLTKRPERMLRYFSERTLGDALSTVQAINEPIQAPRWAHSVCSMYRLDDYFSGTREGTMGYVSADMQTDKRYMPEAWPLPNLWLGVSVEDQAAADARIPLLLQTPAAVRVVSAEPLLGPVGIAKLNGIDWVIVGGESGPKARHCNISWIRSLLDQCLENKVSCFIKQLGSNPVYEIGDRLVLQSKKGNDMEEWPNGIRVRQWPEGER